MGIWVDGRISTVRACISPFRSFSSCLNLGPMALCNLCNHEHQEDDWCGMIIVYSRGPDDPPGNRRCLCGYDLTFQVGLNISKDGIIK